MENLYFWGALCIGIIGFIYGFCQQHISRKLHTEICVLETTAGMSGDYGRVECASMNTCSSCQYWKVSREKKGEKGLTYGTCMYWKMNSEVYYDHEQTDRWGNTRRDVAFASGYEGVPLHLETGPDFGCIHHECK